MIQHTMKAKILIYLVIMTAFFSASAQNFTLPLWPDGVPNSRRTEQTEKPDTAEIVRISHVQDPAIEVYLPSKRNANGQAVVIAPGGGYAYLAYDWEGIDVAKMLNAHGIAGIVLKYRLPDDDSNVEPHLSPLMDAQQAMMLVRKNAEQWSIDPKQIGIMGFSAGGHLASTLGTHYDELSRPDFMALIYPVISMKDGLTHGGSRTNLLGENPDGELVIKYSNEEQVTADTPPTFLVHSTDDGAVPVENSLRFYEALKSNKVPVEMHIYPYGGHGYSIATDQGGHLATWPELLVGWLERIRERK